MTQLQHHVVLSAQVTSILLQLGHFIWYLFCLKHNIFLCVCKPAPISYISMGTSAQWRQCYVLSLTSWELWRRVLKCPIWMETWCRWSQGAHFLYVDGLSVTLYELNIFAAYCRTRKNTHLWLWMYTMGTPGIFRILRFRSLSFVAIM